MCWRVFVANPERGVPKPVHYGSLNADAPLANRVSESLDDRAGG